VTEYFWWALGVYAGQTKTPSLGEKKALPFTILLAVGEVWFDPGSIVRAHEAAEPCPTH